MGLKGLCEGYVARRTNLPLVVTSNDDARMAIEQLAGDDVVLRRVDFSDIYGGGHLTCKMIGHVYGSTETVVVVTWDTPKDIWTVLGVAIALGRPVGVMVHEEVRRELPSFANDLPLAVFTSFDQLTAGNLKVRKDLPRLPSRYGRGRPKYAIVPRMGAYGDEDYFWAVAEGLAALGVEKSYLEINSGDPIAALGPIASGALPVVIQAEEDAHPFTYLAYGVSLGANAAGRSFPLKVTGSSATEMLYARGITGVRFSSYTELKGNLSKRAPGWARNIR